VVIFFGMGESVLVLLSGDWLCVFDVDESGGGGEEEDCEGEDFNGIEVMVW